MTLQVEIQAQYEQFITATKAMKEFFGGVMDGMRAELKATADQAEQSMKQHESAFENFATILKSKMAGVTGVVEGVKIAWAQLAVIFEGAHFLAESAEESVKLVRQSQELGRQLGISATEASYLKVALGDVHATGDQYIAMSKGMVTELKKHESEMQALGLQTRDSSGHLKNMNDLVLDGLDILSQYKEGTDRNIAAQTLFGRGIDTSSEALELNRKKLEEAKDKADALGLAVGADNVEAAEKFEAASNDMRDILDGVKNAIGQALLPVLNDLATWFTEYGPQAMLTIRVAIGIVVSLFKGLALAVSTAATIIKANFLSLIDIGQGFAAVFNALLHGDFAAAKDAAVGTMEDLKNNFSSAMTSIMDKAAATGSSITDMWGDIVNPPAVKDSGAGGGDGTIGEKPAKPKKKKKGSDAAARRAAAEAKREAKEKYDALMEGYRGEEEAAKGHYDQLLDIQRQELKAAIAMYGEKSKQAQAIENKIAQTERAAAEQAKRLDAMRAESARNRALAEIDAEQTLAEFRQEQGIITMQQLLQLDAQYEDQRYQIQLAALQSEAAANADKIEEHARTLQAIEQLQLQHEQRMQQIALQSTAEHIRPMQQVFQSLEQGLSSAMQGLLQKTMTLRQAMGTVFQSIYGAVVQMFANWAAAQIVHFARMLIMHKVNAAQKNAIDKAATASGIVKASALAGAQGTASFSAAPWPIDMGAPAFGAAMAAASLAYMAGASAAQGYDIPSGVNPVTQLHQREMVLPAKHADVIRDMADGGGGKREGDTHLHVNAVDARSVAEMFRRNPGALADAARYAQRMGHMVRVG